ncbi:IgGFc-binding protein-like isoform X1 [Vidua chalybeata]|uniref:IgGFc-binding protein-like isoform X1 n=1 Tax=Vidua chalybeata TaxID=81927 RepID=UPI0023A912DB|nr:IgGFc-binding protein-like isoform X1 [Vidua chalybeata]XP_053820110.1 IgGFc-binding protein-like isoform X1 [Vidua chalybeata]XP_053820111.1 IgGFc-binding protein-like isoform X1 [Vidua chalybeata]XP_053820112.1 IgGFc-binding protein-like isoform X1 [Vidua chalybeata]
MAQDGIWWLLLPFCKTPVFHAKSPNFLDFTVTSFFLVVFFPVLCICISFSAFSHFSYIYAFPQHFPPIFIHLCIFSCIFLFSLFIGKVCMYIPLPCNLFTIFTILLHLCPFFLHFFIFISYFPGFPFLPSLSLQPHEMLFQDHCQRHCTCVPGQGLACHDHACTEDKSCEIQEKVLGCIKKALTLTYKEPAPTSWPNPMGTTLGCCPSGSRPRMTSVVGSNLCPISPWSMLTSMDNTSPSTGMKMAESGVNREVMLLPVLLADGKVRVRPTGLRVVLDTDFGLRVSYYWNWHPRSTSPAATSAKSVASAGISTSSPLMISPRLVYHCNYHMGQIWKSADSEVNHWICWGYCDGPCPVCDEEKKELYGGNHYCGIIKKSFQGPFRA